MFCFCCVGFFVFLLENHQVYGLRFRDSDVKPPCIWNAGRGFSTISVLALRPSSALLNIQIGRGRCVQTNHEYRLWASPAPRESGTGRMPHIPATSLSVRPNRISSLLLGRRRPSAPPVEAPDSLLPANAWLGSTLTPAAGELPASDVASGHDPQHKAVYSRHRFCRLYTVDSDSVSFWISRIPYASYFVT